MRDLLPIRTERLILRALCLSDVEVLAMLANDKSIASMTLTIPHPYTTEESRSWLERVQEEMDRRAELVAGICLGGGSEELIGVVSIGCEWGHRRGVLGYWIAREHWNHGYMTEAASAMLGVAFDRLDLHRVYATHFARNPASGAVLRKLGMRHEGVLREHVFRWSRFEDSVCYGILRHEFNEMRRRGTGSASEHDGASG